MRLFLAKMVAAWRRPSEESRLCLPWISCQFAANLLHRLMPDAATACAADSDAGVANAVAVSLLPPALTD